MRSTSKKPKAEAERKAEKKESKPLKLRKRGFLSFLRDIAGNATTETVIMLPVFIIIWGGIYYTHQRYRKAINMGQYTRAHTWQHAYGACQGSSPSANTRIGDYSTSMLGFIGGEELLPLGDDILPGFDFQQVEGRRNTSLERPAVLGEGNVSMEHNIVMLCNEERREANLWEQAWTDYFPDP